MALSIVGLLEIYSASSYRLVVTQEDPKSLLFVNSALFCLVGA